MALSTLGGGAAREQANKEEPPMKKQKLRHRLLSVVLSMVLLASLTPAAFASYPNQYQSRQCPVCHSDNCTWTVLTRYLPQRGSGGVRLHQPGLPQQDRYRAYPHRLQQPRRHLLR